MLIHNLKCFIGFHDNSIMDIQFGSVYTKRAVKILWKCDRCDQIWSEIITDPIIVYVLRKMRDADRCA